MSSILTSILITSTLYAPIYEPFLIFMHQTYQKEQGWCIRVGKKVMKRLAILAMFWRSNEKVTNVTEK